MTNEILPLEIEGIDENIYAGFWERLGSLLVDALVYIPISLLTLYVNSFDKNIYFLTFIPNLLFTLWYGIYLPKRYGGTPGKLVVGIKIICKNGDDINWREAILRHSFNIVLSLIHVVIMTISILKADNSIFKSMAWLHQNSYLVSMNPVLFHTYIWISNIWFYGELIVLMTNKRKRAIHDYIAGTVIVKSKYINEIKESMIKCSENDSFTEY